MLPAAISRGFGSILGAPALLLWLWLANLLVALPAGVWMAHTLREAVGPSLAAESLKQGFDLGWFEEFDSQASGLEKTFSPSLVGVGAFLENLEAWLWGDLFLRQPALVALGGCYLLLWLWLLGGVLDRVVKPPRPFELSAFLGASCRYFPRLFRLSLVAALFYGGLYLGVRRFFPWLSILTRDWTAEWRVLAANLAAALVVVALLSGVQVVFEYAKILLVARERRNALGMLVSAMGFVLRNPLRVAGVYLFFGSMTVAALISYGAFGPGVGQSTPLGLLLAFLAGQGIVLARIALRVMRLGAEAELVRRIRTRFDSAY